MDDININNILFYDNCEHTIRGCKIFAPCCNKFFHCRVCHDIEMNDNNPDYDKQHKLDGKTVVKICRAEACQAMGSDALIEHAEKCLGTPMHSTSEDGSVTLEPTYCLGNCALSPAVMINGELKGRVTPERFDALIAEVKGVAK